MRLVYVVQRYGREVAGGAEAACRMFAERMALRGHEVEVITSCALSYVDWADQYSPGTEVLEGVTVRRLPVVDQRHPIRFGELSRRVLSGPRPVPATLQAQWLAEQGPWLDGFASVIDDRASACDIVAFYTYLYRTTTDGLPLAWWRAPTLLHPAAHEERPFRLTAFDRVLRHTDGLFFHSLEEAQLTLSRIGNYKGPVATIGLGVGVTLDDPDVSVFRTRFGIGDRPYLLLLGRIDPNKGSLEAYEFFLAMKRRSPGPLMLVVVGEQVHDLPVDPDVVTTGFVTDDLKQAALAGALALVIPSYYESFSLVLVEAWLLGVPAIVQGGCEVLAGQARRSGGAIAYRGFAMFEAAVEVLVGDEGLRRHLASAGRNYAESNYAWDVVLDRYEDLLDRTIVAGRKRLAS